MVEAMGIPDGEKTRVLLVDDHEFTLEGVRFYFADRPEFEVVGTARDGIEAVEAARRSKPHVVILDMKLRHMTGLEAARLLLEAFPCLLIIAFSIQDDPATVFSVIQAGARGYVSKDCHPNELLDAVTRVRRGQIYLGQSISKVIEHDFLRKATQDRVSSIAELTGPERQVLALVASGLTNKEMAERMKLSVRTVEKYRQTLMAKLKIPSVAGLTKFAIRHGLSALDA